MRKLLTLVALVLVCSPVLHAKQEEVVRCATGSPRWQGKAGKFKVVLDVGNPPGECRLSISRGDTEMFSTHAKIVDVLARRTDLNMDAEPDLAFQTGPTGECCWTLHILSLNKVPSLVGEIQNRLPFAYRGEGNYGAPEFVAQDGALAAGFDGLTADELTDLPTLAIQWDGTKAVDVSSRHAGEYEGTAAKLEAQLKPEQIGAFRQSDGKLDASGPETHLLRETKARVLAMALGHLYAANEGSASAKLEEFWPPSDLPRIHKLVAEALGNGLRSRLVQPPVFVNRYCQGTADAPIVPIGGKVKPPRATYSPDPEYTKQARAESFQGTVVLGAVITADGCVRELRLVRRLGRGLDEKAINAVLGWKFEPATQGGRPVPVRVNIEVNFRLY